MNAILEWCMQQSSEAPAVETAEQWVLHWPAHVNDWASTVMLAIAGGFKADRLAWAFASGYQGAIRAIVRQAEAHEIFAFCATETVSNPLIVNTKWRYSESGKVIVNGIKSWAPMGHVCTSYLVACAELGAPEQTRPPQRVVRLASSTPGLKADPLPSGGIIPELGRARVQLLDASTDASNMLEGDGWSTFIKPFKRVEALHVAAAVLAHLLREGRSRKWPSSYMQRVLTSLAVLCDLSRDWSAAPMTNVVLADAIDNAHMLAIEAQVHWTRGELDESAARWERDRGMLSISAAVQERSAARAWEHLHELQPRQDSQNRT
ncbi:Acyl-CoA dehydrogenase [Collimonas sp. OK307]|uniref:hypothetical protein n=1 Tax=Collimonas sp. OK307 TaxID=1801620 RepID=UPI0008EF160E|nr:hypothetical protein [Collimonas sp. OK307]SFI32004.1 Acyl-CoA dehydrogenase [Collimonas sp. OK307]